MPRAPTALAPETFTEFGALLRYLRRRARLTQRDIAIAVGYSESHISRFEQGYRPPDEAALRALFIPALGLDEEPLWAERLLILAAAARTVFADDPEPAPAEVPVASSPPMPAQPPPAEFLPGLLATKLFRPRPRDDLVPRPRLDALLDQVRTLPLTLVAAPAGSGKTTLVASWCVALETGGTPVAWLSLDDGDNQLNTFVRYLVAAFRILAPSAGAATLAALEQHIEAPAILLTPLLNDLARLNGHHVLIFDDYHVLTEPIIHRLMGDLVARLPPQLHLVIVSREDPALPLPRLRARRQLLEIRAADLRFSTDEAAAFLGDVMNLVVSAEEAQTLNRRTEGWAAGLQFAALALRDRPDRTALLAGLTGSNRYLVDYLASEVLDQLPAHRRSFLLQTAILDRMCGPLCDAVLELDTRAAQAEGAYSQLLLEELERANLFLVPLDAERRWYRYHHLFAEVLRARLRRGAAPEKVAALHLRASRWLEAQGLLDEAMQHALAVRPQTAADLISRHCLHLTDSGRLSTLGAYIRQLPPACLNDYPNLVIYLAWALLLYGDADETERLVGRYPLEHFARPDLGPEVYGGRLVLDGALHLRRGDAAAAVAGFASLDPQVLGPRATAAARLYWSEAALALGDLDAAQSLIELLLQDGIDRGSSIIFWGALSNLGLAYLRRGRLSDMVRLVEQVTALPNRPVAETPLLGVPDLLLGVVAYQRNQLVQAEELLARGVERLWAGVEWKLLLMGVATLALVRQARGDQSGADALLERSLHWIDAMLREERDFVRGLMLEGAINLAAARGDPATARRLAAEAGTALLLRGHVQVALIEATGGQPTALTEEHVGWLDAEIAAREKPGDESELIRLLGMRALAAYLRSDAAIAYTTLNRALTLAEPENIIRVLSDLGPAMGELLQAARAQSRAPAFIERLLAAFPPC